MATTIPQIPEFNSVIDDSPAFHQSLKYWTYKSSQFGSSVHEIASSLRDYHETGSSHYDSGNAFSEVLSGASQLFKDDSMLEEPLSKFSDALSRIECYRAMLLTQTETLGVDAMMNMVKDMEETKKCRNRVTKLSETMHVSWEKFAALPHESNLTDSQQLHRNAHNMITMRQKYQLLLAEYIEHIRDTNTTKKVGLLQRVLEHMFAEFSYFNYCCQILKDLEPYMTKLFDTLQKKQRDYEQLTLLNNSYRRETETKIDLQAQALRNLFPLAENHPVASSTPAHFFNKVGGFISSGVKDLKKQYKDSSVVAGVPKDESDWEVIDDPSKGKEHHDESSQFYVPLNEEVLNGGDLNREDKEETSIAAREDNDDNNSNEDKQETNVDETLRNDMSDEVTDGIFGKNNKVSPIDIPQRFERGGLNVDSTVSKTGYLRIKQRGYHKSKYPLLYFILDKEYGELLSQGQDQKNPRLFAKLQLASVKPCNSSETDRNFCFILRTSDAEYILQASNSLEYEEWIREIQDGIMTALNCTVDDRRRSHVRGASLKAGTLPEGHKPKQSCGNVVERIKRVDGNTLCADCNCPQPGWASSNIGVVICIECCGIHRGLGVQISKIKSLSLDKWEPSLVEFMESRGNTVLNKVLEANLTVEKITRLSSKKERLDYIVSKYVDKLFMEEEETLATRTCNNECATNGDEHIFDGEEEDIDTADKKDVDTEEHIVDYRENIDTKNECVVDKNSGVELNVSGEDFVLSDTTDEDSGDILDTSVMCLVKNCQDCSHCHPPSLSDDK